MAVRVVRLGTPKGCAEGLRIGTVRLLPRGVDVWLPEVSPSRALVSYARVKPWTDARWAAYAQRYLREMRRPEAIRLITLLAALSKKANFSIGCYCESPSRCHRSLLGKLLREQGGKVDPLFR